MKTRLNHKKKPLVHYLFFFSFCANTRIACICQWLKIHIIVVWRHWEGDLFELKVFFSHRVICFFCILHLVFCIVWSVTGPTEQWLNAFCHSFALTNGSEYVLSPTESDTQQTKTELSFHGIIKNFAALCNQKTIVLFHASMFAVISSPIF